MMGEPEGNIIKRAFEIASECGSIQEVKRRLIQEGYGQVGAHLAGSQIRRDIGCRLNPRLKARSAETDRRQPNEENGPPTEG